MRSNCFKAMFLALLAISLAACVQTAQAQVLQLVTPTTKWRYNQSGANLDIPWRAPAYDDTVAGWKGPSNMLFGFETSPAEYLPQSFRTPFPDPVTQSPFITNYYFRTHFTMPNNTPAILAGTLLSTTNWIDDGMVCYLNGVEIFRFNMPAGPITATTFASAALSPEGYPPTGLTVINRANLGTNLVVGDNVLAVEVHQAAIGSSDEVFGMTLTATLPGLVITKQPVGQTNVIGARVTNSVIVIGSSPSYQWYKNGTKVPLANAPNYLLSSAQLTNSGDYFVIITNKFGSVTSDVVTVSIVVDTFPLTLVSALAGAAAPVNLPNNQVLVTFNKPLLLTITATNLSNYLITILGTTNVIGINKIVYVPLSGGAQAQATLTASKNLGFGTNYILLVNNVADSKTNVVAPNSMIGIGLQSTNPINLFPIYQAWWENENGYDLASTGTGWFSSSYNEGADGCAHIDTDGCWVNRGALFYNFQNNHPTLCPGYADASLITWGFQTYYFRTRFQSASNAPPAGELVFNYFFDDGAVFYLNGTELWRTNMPAGAVNYSTPGVQTVPSCRSVSIPVSTNQLLAYPKTNVLAVELHQNNTDQTQNDTLIYFGVSLDFAFTQTSPLPPKLNFVRRSLTNGSVVTLSRTNIVSWVTNTAGISWGLEYTPNLGPGAVWTPLTNASPYIYTNPITGNKFFRGHSK